jgi:7-cyano-7-deazaguanine synthase in queuosine biosynthesis
MIKKMRHILMMSGGKDSTALAIYMRDKVEVMNTFANESAAQATRRR